MKYQFEYREEITACHECPLLYYDRATLNYHCSLENYNHASKVRVHDWTKPTWCKLVEVTK